VSFTVSFPAVQVNETSALKRCGPSRSVTSAAPMSTTRWASFGSEASFWASRLSFAELTTCGGSSGEKMRSLAARLTGSEQAASSASPATRRRGVCGTEPDGP
jgi:hypothetical protein